MLALALSSDPSAVTALGNDYGFENIFARQVEAFGRKGDVLVVITTSGKSHNVIRAAAMASGIGMRTVALTGGDADPILRGADVWLPVPSNETPRVQELHTALLHAISEMVELAIAPPADSRE
jgi:D-sedoheptulose 7-phosphate isomerase